MAATSVITCPECAKKFKGREGLEGKKVRCPGCGHPFIVQTMAEDKVDSDEDAAPAKAPAKEVVKAKAKAKAKAPAPARTAPAPAAAAAPPRRSALDEELDQDGNPYGVSTPDLRPRCPNCAEELRSSSDLICLHCGYNTQTRSLGKTRKTLAHTGGERLKWLLPGLGCALGMFIVFAANLYYCVALPTALDPNSWLQFLNHESLRLWIASISLALIWGLGYFAQKRLLLEPTPPEKVKE